MTRRLVLCLVALALSVSSSPAGDPQTAEELLERYVKAIGGREALLATKTLSATGTLSAPAQGMNGQLSIRAKAPDKTLQILSVQGMGEMRQGYDGKVAWSEDPFLGLRALEGSEHDTFVREADFYAALNWKKHYPETEFLGRVGEGEEATFAVRMVPADGYAETRHFDPKSFLLIRIEKTVPHAMGEVPVVQRLSDYREISGVMIPFRLETEIGGVTATVAALEELKHNLPVDDSIFAMPEKEKAPAGAEKTGP